jgi:ribonuclease Y
MLTLIAALLGLLIGSVAATTLLLFRTRSRVRVARREADTITREARIDAREQAVHLRANVEEELAERRTAAAKVEERLNVREQDLERRAEELARREQGVADRETHVRQLQEELKAAREEALKELQRVAGLTVADAKQHLLARSKDLIRHELARTARQLEEEARVEARRRARNLVADALQRGP